MGIVLQFSCLTFHINLKSLWLFSCVPRNSRPLKCIYYSIYGRRASPVITVIFYMGKRLFLRFKRHWIMLCFCVHCIYCVSFVCIKDLTRLNFHFRHHVHAVCKHAPEPLIPRCASSQSKEKRGNTPHTHANAYTQRSKNTQCVPMPHTLAHTQVTHIFGGVLNVPLSGEMTHTNTREGREEGERVNKRHY